MTENHKILKIVRSHGFGLYETRIFIEKRNDGIDASGTGNGAGKVFGIAGVY